MPDEITPNGEAQVIQESTVTIPKKGGQQAIPKGKDELFESLILLSPERLQLWKYFEERSDLLMKRLWTTGTWLVGFLGATLTLPFAAEYLVVKKDGILPVVIADIPLGLIAAFGFLFSVFALYAVAFLKEHTEDNWRRARFARLSTWDANIQLPTSTLTGWIILLILLILELIAFAGLFLLACFHPG